jgi:uncharacterized membrane protein
MADSPDSSRELREIRRRLIELTARIYRLEQVAGIAQAPVATTPTPPAEPEPAVGQAVIRPKSAKQVSSDLESRIGSHWLNRIGIAAVLMGVSYFLKFAFENNWIGPAGRVTIGLVAGIGVVLWSERFRTRGYQIFSYSLKAVGVGVLYLSLWAAFQLYDLIPGTVAFLAMLAVTAATTAMAVAQDAEILAAFALIGGFVTPILLSTGVNREVELFSYLMLLDAATLLLAALRPWRRLLLISFFGTLALYTGWYFSFYERSQLRITLGFATVFFAIFAVAPLAGRRREGEARSSSALPLVLAFLNAATYFVQVYALLWDVDRPASAFFAVALAAVYILLSRQVSARYADPTSARTMHFVHLALAIGFLTIAVPIRLDTHWITLGWFVEAGVLLWIANRLGSDFLNFFAVAALALGVARLLFFDNFYSTTLIFNARMATHAVAIAILALIALYGARRGDERGRTGAAIAVVSLNLLALIAFSREVGDYYQRQMYAIIPSNGRWTGSDWVQSHNVRIARDFSYSTLWMIYGAVLMLVGFRRRSSFVRWQALVLIAVTVVKVFAYDVSNLDRGYRIISFVVLGVLLLAISFVYQRDWLRLSRKSTEGDSTSI